MTAPPHARPRRPGWLVPAFIALMLMPLPAAIGVLVAVGVGMSIARSVQAGRARGERDAAIAAGATVLGSDSRGREVLLGDRQLAAHALIVGASGAGKSTTLLQILTDHVRRGRPVVAIDLKGSPDFARTLEQAATAAGRPFALWTPDGPSHWNPLAHGNSTELKDKLITTERFTEPHYRRAAERYVQTALQVLAHAHPERSATLGDVVRLMDPRRMPSMLRNVPEPLRERVQDYLAGMTPDQVSAVRGLATRLAIITESEAGPFLAPGRGPGIDLRRALAGEQVVLFSLNSSRYGSFAAQIGTLVVQDLNAAVGHRMADPARHDQAVIGLDEFSALGSDHVLALLARAREAGVSVLLATQELADLERAARGLLDQVLGNTSVKIAHRQDVHESARKIAEIAGYQTVWEETRQISGQLFGGLDTGRGTRRAVERLRVHPDEIKTLRTGEALVITKVPRADVRTVRVAAPRPREGPER